MSSTALRLPAIYAFATNTWDGPWMNRQQLLSRLARRGWPVIYSTGALSVWDRDSEEWRNAAFTAKQRREDHVQVDVAGRFPPTWPSRKFYDRWAVATYCRGLKRRAAVPPGRATIAYLFRPRFLPYAQALGCRYLVYHAADIYSQMPGWSPELARLEEETVLRADLIIGTTASVLAALPGRGPAPRRVLHNAADAAAFAEGPSLPCPDDLAAIPRPRIGYIGHLNRKVDFNLIAAIARARPNWQWVLVGPVPEGVGHPSQDAAVAAAFMDCQHLPNVHFLNYKPPSALPRYVGHMDVNVMIYRQDQDGWWSSAYPLKLHEYLAGGRPVVSTPLSEIQPLGHIVDMVDTQEKWLASIERALTKGGVGTAKERQAVAFANTWDARVDQLEGWLRELVSRAAAR